LPDNRDKFPFRLGHPQSYALHQRQYLPLQRLLPPPVSMSVPTCQVRPTQSPADVTPYLLRAVHAFFHIVHTTHPPLPQRSSLLLSVHGSQKHALRFFLPLAAFPDILRFFRSPWSQGRKWKTDAVLPHSNLWKKAPAWQ